MRPLVDELGDWVFMTVVVVMMFQSLAPLA